MGRRGILGSRQGHGLPLGHSKLMGSLTRLAETNINELLKDKNTRGDVDRKDKAKKREGIKEAGIPENADWWRKEAMEKKAGIFAS
jgi:hypothetical protein